MFPIHFIFITVTLLFALDQKCAMDALYCKASVTILADFCPEFNPPFRWRSKRQTKNTVHINNLVPFEFPNGSSRSARSFTSTQGVLL